uniref:BED-type domain-containing protein n=1 Tax=Bursaphelenchus xylophilus TaxID=6326 RepID=A0A1I7SBX7_BURXY
MESPKAIVSPIPNPKVPRNARSTFWRHFEKGMNKEGKEVVRCLYCTKEYLGRGITTSVRYHAEQEHGVREEEAVKMTPEIENEVEIWAENGNTDENKYGCVS